MNSFTTCEIESWLEPYKELKYDNEKSCIFCSLCDVFIKVGKKVFIVNHVKSVSHQSNCGEYNLLLDWIEPYNELVISADKTHIHCSACDTTLKLKKSVIMRHVNSQNHQKRTGNISDFYLDLCLFLVNCNIAWNKVNHPEFKKFFNKYICCACGNKRLPEQSVLSKVFQVSSRQSL